MKAVRYLFILLLLFASAMQSPAQAQQAKWTFMVYLDADNNLEDAGIEDFNEMEMVGSSTDVQIVVQIDRSPQYDASNGNWSDTRRYRIIQDNNPTTMTSPVLQNLGEANMGDPQALIDFINWARQNFPAQHYCLVLWDHGGGWRNRNIQNRGLQVLNAPLPPQVGLLSNRIRANQNHTGAGLAFRNPFRAGWGRNKDICYDDTDNDFLSSNEVASALQASGITFDIIGYDACLMAMLENAYEIRNHANYMVGSEETEPGAGWPYDLQLAPLKANPNMTAATLARTIVQKYGDFYRNSNGDNQTQSAFDLSQLNAVITGVNDFANAIINDNSVWSQAREAFANANNFNENQHRDLYHFADGVAARVSNTAITNAANSLKNAISNLVIENYAESEHGSSRGVAIYFPPASAFDPKYASGVTQVDFPKDTQWDEFLSAFYNAGTGQTTFDPYEPNDNFAQAYGPVISAQVYEGYLTEDTDVDMYKVVTGSTFDLRIDLAVPADFDLYLVQLIGNQVDTLSASEQFGAAAEHIALTGVPGGTYYVIVSPYETDANPYQLRVEILGGGGNVDVILGYDDGTPEYGIFSNRQDLNEGVACYFRPPAAPAKLKGFWYHIFSIDVVPGGGNNGSFYTFGADYYGPVLPDTFRYATPGGVGWNFLDLSSDNIVLYGDFFAGMFWDRFNTPAIGWDTTATNGINLIYTDFFGIPDWYLGDGTYFIRAEVSYVNVTTGVEETALLEPRRFSLEQNYPNPFGRLPFNPETMIRYTLPFAGEVNLAVYDLAGRRVATVESGFKSAGEHAVRWDGRDRAGQRVASGVYFYRLEATSPKQTVTTLTKRMIMLK
ncbi:MAG: clostripain-related cysteine peptidase [candidate division KSB1 bacterium]|nr:clostripain-related cysteine peptidase [candidate division KSB1 bacterium]MDZ7301515.1 clostripain-related cysteine peptidase [candidate division KSB1 bacterium]